MITNKSLYREEHLRFVKLSRDGVIHVLQDRLPSEISVLVAHPPPSSGSISISLSWISGHCLQLPFKTEPELFKPLRLQSWPRNPTNFMSK